MLLFQNNRNIEDIEDFQPELDPALADDAPLVRSATNSKVQKTNPKADKGKVKKNAASSSRDYVLIDETLIQKPFDAPHGQKASAWNKVAAAVNKRCEKTILTGKAKAVKGDYCQTRINTLREKEKQRQTLNKGSSGLGGTRMTPLEEKSASLLSVVSERFTTDVYLLALAHTFSII